MALTTATVMGISAGVSALTAGVSLAQAEKQRRLAEDAQRDADNAFKDAEGQLEVNYFEQLGISKTPYLNQREAIAQAGAQAIEAAGASERGGAATAGRILAQSNIAQQGITDQQTKDLQNLEKIIATEDASLGAKKAELSLAQAEGAGIASAQAQNLQNQAVQSGINNIANTGLAILSNSELYGQNPTNETIETNNTDSFGVFASDANPYPQVVPSQNMMTPAQQFLETSNNFNASNLLYNPFKIY